MKHITTVAIAMMAFSAHVQAFTAFAFSESANPSRSFAVVTDVDSLEKAKLLAVESCAKNSGKKDCKVLLTGTKPGFGAIYGTCVTSEDCFFSFGTGYRSRNAAHDGVLAQCRREYGVTDCMPYGEWQETVGMPSSASASTTIAAEKRGATRDNQTSRQALLDRDKSTTEPLNMNETVENPRSLLSTSNHSDAGSKWTSFSAYSEDGYVDLNTIIKNGQMAKFRVLRDHFEKRKVGDGISYKSDISEWEFDCKNKTAKRNWAYLFSEQMGKGKRYEAEVSTKVKSISPDFMRPTTEHDSLFYFACGTPGGYKNFSNQSDPKWFRYCDHRETAALTADDIARAKKREIREIGPNDEVEKLKAKKYGKTLDLGKGQIKLSVDFPTHFNGPYDGARNPGFGYVGKKPKDFMTGEMMFNGRIGNSRTISHYASVFAIDKSVTRVDVTPEHMAANHLRTYGFDICRAERVEWPITIQGGNVAVHKASGYSIYNGTESQKDKDDRLAVFVLTATLPEKNPGEISGYTFVTAIYEKDLASYEANPRALVDAARAEFEKTVKTIKVVY